MGKTPRRTATRRSASPPSPAQPFGQKLLDCSKQILRRCEEAGVRLDVPGEGGERRFRYWLATDFIVQVLGWPNEKVVVGERFDVILQDPDNFPLATIETKTPYSKASKKERGDFEARLSTYGTLRTAFFTNGNDWERLDIVAPAGRLEIREKFHLNLDSATPAEAEAFFSPIFGDRFFKDTPRLGRHSVSRENPPILEALAADFDQAVSELTNFFRMLFRGLRTGQAGQPVRDVTTKLFNLWCEKSLVVSPQEAAEQLSKRFSEGLLTRDIPRALADLGLTGPGPTRAAENLALLPEEKRGNPEAVQGCLWTAYDQAVENLCIQTAHVILARTVLYRVGEDQNVFPRSLSSDELRQALASPMPTVIEAPLPAADLLDRVRRSMESFLPTVYKLGEFDWWLVPSDKRAQLNPTERAWLRQTDTEFERVAQRLLRMLDGYFFGAVDVDVWRNVYQHYLPEEERQRIGGFYTPDELVYLILDLLDYKPEREGLCQLSFLDPACGSGAFVSGALGRLLEHLSKPLPCHAELRQRIPDWKRAEIILTKVAENLHAVDIHPFAAFLTTLNTLFLILPLCVKAREKNRDFWLELQVFSADALEKGEADLLKPGLFDSINSRVQLTKDSLRRYQKMLERRFDRIFGNPPWGGVLKGRLAPVYDKTKKNRFAHEFPHATQGKYDVYGLFMERATQFLKSGGRFGLLTQDTFIDKKWANGLRELLAKETTLNFIVDLNPFGQLFFRAMNTPCITVADNQRPDDGECFAVLSAPPTEFKDLSRGERRGRVVKTVREALKKLSGREKPAVVGFARSARIPRAYLKKTAGKRWDLSGLATTAKLPAGCWTAADLLEMRQGVTPGGCLDVFLMDKEKADRLGLEKELVHRAIKSKNLKRWRAEWDGKAIFYPYHLAEDGAEPAFSIALRELRDEALVGSVREVGLVDALDFDRHLDSHESEITRRSGLNRESLEKLLRHRAALGLVKYPGAAAYLVEHYDRLASRVFEQKRFTDMGKRWYEYHRPRDPKIILARKRIVSPTLTKPGELRFALDTAGYLSDHACWYLQPTAKTDRVWRDLLQQLRDVLGRRAGRDDGLKYCLAFLNSARAKECLTAGHRPTPKGFYAISEEYLREIPIPPPKKKKQTAGILNLVSRLVDAKSSKDTGELEKELSDLVDAVYSL